MQDDNMPSCIPFIITSNKVVIMQLVFVGQVTWPHPLKLIGLGSTNQWVLCWSVVHRLLGYPSTMVGGQWGVGGGGGGGGRDDGGGGGGRGGGRRELTFIRNCSSITSGVFLRRNHISLKNPSSPSPAPPPMFL